MIVKPIHYGLYLLLGSLAFGIPLAEAQNPSVPPTWIPDIKFSSGREVLPYLEGWILNHDGSFDFVFGYFNRNWEQELAIPVGAENSVMPGGPDRGQPTYFLPRRQSRIFRVRVPKDWGDKVLTWSITANGRTETVMAQLLPAEEINERIIASGNNSVPSGEEEDPNQPPSITIAPVTAAGAAKPFTLTAMVTDDGLPKPRPAAPARTAVSPGPSGQFQAQRNSSGDVDRFVGLRVTWLEYRGPAKVTFDINPIPVAKGTAVTTARFAAPGTYTLVATANDGKLSTRSDVVVIVK